MWPDADKTQSLLDKAGAGDADAVDQLLAQHREPIRRMIDLRLDPAIVQRLDASDIVQDVLIEANRRLKEYLKNPTMPFHLWLRHIAKDHLIDAHRRHHKAQKRGVEREQPIHRPAWSDRSSLDLAGQLLDQDLTPASAAIQEEMQNRLRDAIAQLDDDDREVILMRHYEMLANQEVAATLGLTEAAASMRYLRAVRKLRDLLAPTR
ncbi:MAG: sigma-70 family RNA polymerase sigma factor [Planctomycetes bacterium]|nr:sigma-70 family RNA polymerase sigma factor [Planctomycetota bacterium]